MRKIDIGSAGSKLHEGWIGIDKFPLCCPDIIRDVNKGLPFDSDSVDEIRCIHTFEHLDDPVFVLFECWRVLKDGGIIFIEMPHAKSYQIHHDPDHKVYWMLETFNRFENRFEILEKEELGEILRIRMKAKKAGVQMNKINPVVWWIQDDNK